MILDDNAQHVFSNPKAFDNAYEISDGLFSGFPRQKDGIFLGHYAAPAAAGRGWGAEAAAWLAAIARIS